MEGIYKEKPAVANLGIFIRRWWIRIAGASRSNGRPPLSRTTKLKSCWMNSCEGGNEKWILKKELPRPISRRRRA